MNSKIYLVRHTRTIGNDEHRLTGREDYEVTLEGKKYIDLLTKKLENIKFDSAYASTSKRTSKTIQKLADLNNIKITEYEDLCEMYFGIYDGMKWSDVDKINPTISKLHKKTNEIIEIPNQETTAEVANRMNKIMIKIANENLNKTVLICSHGVAIEAFLRSITGIKFTEKREEYSQKNTSINILNFDNEKNSFKIDLLNDISHIENVK